MTNELDDIRLRINAAEAYAADAERSLDCSDDPRDRLNLALTLASIATAQLLHHSAEHAARDAARPGPCGDTQQVIVGPNAVTVTHCTADYGHSGAHTDGVKVWHSLTEVPTDVTAVFTDPSPNLIAHGPAAIRCLTPQPYYRHILCHLNAGHDGDHMAGTHVWQGVIAPVTVDVARCTAERDGSRCVRNTGHTDAHFGAGAEWVDECGAPFDWNPDVKCTRAPGHPSTHSGAGSRWSTGYCSAACPNDPDRWCTRDKEHPGNHRSGAVEWEQPVQGLANLAAADVTVSRRPIPGRLRYMAARIETVIDAIQEERLRHGDAAVLAGIVIALRSIATDVENPPGENGTCDRMDDCCLQPGHEGQCRHPWTPCGLYSTRAQGSLGPCVRDSVHENGPHRDVNGAEW